jgi:NADH-quinone oxidoreductase subunit G
MIARFNGFLTKEGLEDKVELKGSFCMERCGEGINWQINDECLSSPSAEAGAELFRKKVVELLKDKATESPDQRSI